jgi:hypothetical protein
MDDIPIIPLTRLDLRFEPGVAVRDRAARRDRRAFRQAARRQAGDVERARADDARGEIADGVLTGAISKPTSRASSPGATGAFPTRRCATASRWRRCARPTARFCSARWAAHRDRRADLFRGRHADPADVVGDNVDLERSVIRELTEETGLTLADVEPQPGWTATPSASASR